MKKKPIYKRWWLWAIIVFIAVGVALSPTRKEEMKKETKEINTEKSTNQPTEEKKVEKKEKVAEIDNEENPNLGKETVTALESNDFALFVEKYNELGKNKTTVWDNQLNGKKVTWTGTVVRAGSSQLFVYGLEDYKGETWEQLADAKKLYYTFVAKYEDPNQFKNLKTGDKVTVEGSLDSRGDYDFNYNWKLYHAILK